MPDLWETVRAQVKWLNKHNGCNQTEQGMRVLKVSEEYGEALTNMLVMQVGKKLGDAAAAWISFTGQNPRKGKIRQTDEDVANELVDTAISALVAVESIGFDAQTMVLEKAEYLMNRTEEYENGN